MEFFIYWLEKLNLDLVIIAIVFLSGFFQDKYLLNFYLSKNDRLDKSFKTLMVSFIASAVYILLSYDKTLPMSWAKYFISYFTATSLYDLLIKPVINLIKAAAAKSNNPENDKPL